ncbi:MAG: hypothetical protein JSW12_00855 [Deltaproteobacteria bacterium]|nr:MAG: hypothetical protein JSW12_00855 [Deltaproteobacteria bacterium]
METSLLKVRIAVLYIFLAVWMSASMILLLMRPGTHQPNAGERGAVGMVFP